VKIKPLRELKDLITTSLYDTSKLKAEEQFLKKELANAGGNKRELRIYGKLKRIWCVADYEKWENATHEEWREQWDLQEEQDRKLRAERMAATTHTSPQVPFS
jgi:hypothetical protein